VIKLKGYNLNIAGLIVSFSNGQRGGGGQRGHTILLPIPLTLKVPRVTNINFLLTISYKVMRINKMITKGKLL